MTDPTFAPFDPARLRHQANPIAANATWDPEVQGDVIDSEALANAQEEVTSWTGYAPTPLVELPGLAKALSLGAVYYKDEGARFGLGSFKALGGAYAVCCLLAEQVAEAKGLSEVTSEELRDGTHADVVSDITVTSATDGNHGRSVAWGAQQFGCNCVIYIHAEVSEGREQALKDLGAEVVRVPGNYDETVRRCTEDAASEGRFVVSDTSWEGYREIPRHVMEGYGVMATEVAEELGEQAPTHIFVQGGVGGLAGAVGGACWLAWPDARPRLIVVEPELAACLFESARQGEPAAVEVEEETLMAGLSCGEISPLAWDLLKAAAEDFLTIPEDFVVPAMRLMARSPFGDPAVVAGESAVAGLAGLIAVARDPARAAALGLDGKSRVLLFGTEGATDAAIYHKLVGDA